MSRCICCIVFFFTDTATTEIYTLSLTTLFRSRCARPGHSGHQSRSHLGQGSPDRKSTRLNSSHVAISYAVFCMKKNNPLQPLAAPDRCQPQLDRPAAPQLHPHLPLPEHPLLHV